MDTIHTSLCGAKRSCVTRRAELWNLTDEGLRYFTYGSQHTLCPNLLNLTLFIHEISVISIDQLTNMINSRLNQTHGGQEVTIELRLRLRAKDIKAFLENSNFRKTYDRIAQSHRSKITFDEAFEYSS